MAIRKTGSRRIVVDDVAYLWRIRPRPSYSQAIGESNLTIGIQRQDRSGAVLVCRTDIDRPDSWCSAGSYSVSPHDIQQAIKSGLAAGWNPEAPGPQFVVLAPIEDKD